MKTKKVYTFLMAGVIGMSALTGCGINKDEVVATYKGGKAKLGEANFIARYNQLTKGSLYKQQAAGDIWNMDLTGNGTTMADSEIERSLEEYHEMLTMQAHQKEKGVELTKDEKAKIAEASKKFIKDNKKDALEEMTATESVVNEYLTLCTIKEKMYNEIVKDADDKVSDEDANMSSYTAIKIDTLQKYDPQTGQKSIYTDAERNKINETAQKISDEISNGADMKTTAEKYGYTTTESSYAKDDENLDAAVKKELNSLNEGQVSKLIKTQAASYIVRLDKKVDEKATATHRTQIIQTRKQQLYSKILKKWQKKDNWKVKKSAMKKISFKNDLSKKQTKKN
ncbi:peptidyl-prolyl cis-trans isomerase [Lachnobacterium bovis]|uniref:peptidyl-prolyl cis-trans isomerase n=1 Tax=Lachnobacterium bovis TaxID=140626 RepID=UPI0003B3D88E|nr:peptidyl-prolyl cis-trans isomerase [Lachnobacterium bovis]